MASAEEILDEVLLSESDSESEQVVKPSVVHRTADLKEKLEAQITICLEAFNKLDLGNNLDVFKAMFCDKSRALPKPLNHQPIL